MFKAGDVVICIDPCNNIVMDGMYEIEKIHTGLDKVVKLHTTCRLKGVDGAYWLKRFKLADEQPEQAKTSESSSPQGKTTIEVGSPIVVNYVKGQYNVVNYKTTVLKVVKSHLSGTLYTFKAPGPGHGNPVSSEIWSLTAPHVVLDTEDKPFAIGDKVLIVKGYISNNPTSVMAMQDVGKIGPITDMRKSYSSIFNFPCIYVKSYWYAVDAVVPYIDGMDIAKAILDAGSTPPIPEKPRKIINPRKGG